jgi:succinate dehydrogenase hydrophobic anchor subunit
MVTIFYNVLNIIFGVAFAICAVTFIVFLIASLVINDDEITNKYENFCNKVFMLFIIVSCLWALNSFLFNGIAY